MTKVNALEKPPCTCDLCTRFRAIEQAYKKNDAEALHRFLRDLEIENMYLSDDKAMLEAKLKGTLPGGVGLLLDSIEAHKSKWEKFTKSSFTPEDLLQRTPSYDKSDVESFLDIDNNHMDATLYRNIDYEDPQGAIYCSLLRMYGTAATESFNQIALFLFFVPLEEVPEFVSDPVLEKYARWRLERGK